MDCLALGRGLAIHRVMPYLKEEFSKNRFAARIEGMHNNPTFPNPKPLQALRLFLQHKGFDGFFIPRTDEFLNEFIPSYAQRLAWLTGFTGSAGLALVTLHKAILFVDGRYTLQAAQEVDPDWVEIQSWTFTNVDATLRENFPQGSCLAYDPWLHNLQDKERYHKKAEEYGFSFQALDVNPIDALWKDQPPRPKAPLYVHPLEFSGCAFKDKLLSLCAAHPDIQLWVLTEATSLAWLLNIRGGDIPYTPIPQAYGILYQDGAFDFFLDLSKISQEIRDFLGEHVQFFPLEDFSARLRQKARGKKVSVDPIQTPSALEPFLSEATLILQPNPFILPKALKNETELKGIQKAHLVDGIAMTRFLYWLSSIPLDGSENELSVAQKLEKFRQENEHYRGPSFETIAAHGPNGAIVHYCPTPQRNRPLTGGTLFLLDSGGQYAFGGTTDITRTIALGTPTAPQKEFYTRVLKGHIALARAIFPPGTSGYQLDILARLPLWQKGCDFDHGTGHGVGSYLAVHEGPQSISPKKSSIALQPGMVLSNEPGYYETGAYGIRLENLIVVVERKDLAPMLGFETLTLVPFDPQLIAEQLLSPDEKAWIDAYHRQICKILFPHLEVSVQQWLTKGLLNE